MKIYRGCLQDWKEPERYKFRLILERAQQDCEEHAKQYSGETIQWKTDDLNNLRGTTKHLTFVVNAYNVSDD